MKIIQLVWLHFALMVFFGFSCSNQTSMRPIQKGSAASNVSIDSLLKEYKEQFNKKGIVNIGNLAKKLYINDSVNVQNATRYSTCLLANGSISNAIYICKRAIKLDSNYSDAYWNLGMAHMLTNRDSGYFYLNKAISKNYNWYYLFWRSQYYFEDHLYQNSLSDINEAIRLKPNDLDLLIFRAKFKNYNNDFNGALADLKIIPEHRKKDPDVYNILAISYNNLNEYYKAVESCDIGLTYDSNNVYLLFNRALAKSNIDKLGEALEDLRKCSDLGSMECKFYYDQLKASVNKTKEL